MLSRLCYSSLKFVSFKQIASHTHGYLAPTSFYLSKKSNYATTHDDDNSDYARKIEKYTNAGNLEDALNILKQASTINKSFKLDCIKIAELVKLMIEKNYPFEEVEAILSAHSPSNHKSRPSSSLFQNIMGRLAIAGEVQLIKKLFDTLVKYNYIKANIKSTGHLIRCSLQNGAYAQAVDLYEYMGKTYRLAPLSRVLFIQFIQQKEVDLLQRIYKIYEQRRGARHASSCLGFAYSECGHDRQAKANFEKVDVFWKDIILECQNYVKYGNWQKAKNLLTATKGMNCNRGVIYESILDIYIKESKAHEALSLWHEYSNDDILPTPVFKEKLVTLLNANNMKVPLDLDSNADKKKSDRHAVSSDGNITETETLLNKEKNALIIENGTTAGNLENALDQSKQVKNASFKLDCNTVFEAVKSMVEEKHPFEEIEAILSANSPALDPRKAETNFSLFEIIMRRLVITGEVQLLKQLFDALVKYNYIKANAESTRYPVRALLNNGAYAQALDMFEHIVHTYQLAPMSKALFGQLIQHNETDLLKRGFILCEQIHSTQIVYCILGFAFAECGRDQQARKIFEKVNVFWKNVILECKIYVKNGNMQKAKNLLIATKGLNCNRDVIYEAILDICIKQNKPQEALNLWREYANDEKIQTQTFKQKLATFLKTNRIKIPLDLDLNSENEKINS